MISDKIDAITHLPENRKKPVLPAPKSVKIELTGNCNFRCTFCARSHNLRELGTIDEKFFKRILKEMKEEGVEEIGLFYLGESFMVPWLPEAIRYAKTLFPYVFLTTNGSISNPEKLHACMKAGLDSLKFSYNYADSKQLKEIANVKESYFAKIQKHIKDAYKIREIFGFKCGLYASYIEYTGEQGRKMEQAIKEIEPYVDEVYALPLYNQAGFVTEIEKDAGMKPTKGNRGRLENLTTGIPCWALFSEGHISWDGKLTGCCFSHTPDFDFGNLNNSGFMDSWNSATAQWFRRSHLSGDISGTPCEKCLS